MSLTTGLDAQVGVADEVTFGTYQEPDTFLLFTSEGLQRSAERVESEAVGRGADGFVLHEDDYEQGREGAEGPLEFEVPDRGFRLFGKHMLGKVTTTEVVVGEVYEHVCEIDVLDGKSFTTQVGRPRTDGTIVPWSYLGCKVAEWELSCEVDGLVTASLSLDARQETRAQALAARTLIADQRKLAWNKGAIQVDGTEVPVSELNVSGSNAMRTDRFFIQSTDAELKDEQLDGNGRRNYEGSLSGEYRPELEALYDLFVSGAPVPAFAEWTGREIGATGMNYGLRVDLAKIRVDGSTPNVSGAEALEMGVDFTVLAATGQSAVKFTITDDQPGV